MQKKPELDESALAELFKVSPREAYKMVYQHVWDRLFIFAAKEVQDEAIAKDIVQDVFLTLWKRVQESKPPYPVVQYLYGAVNRRVTFELRTQLSRKRQLPDLMMYLDKGSLLADRYVRDREFQKIFEAALDELTEDERASYLQSRAPEGTQATMAAARGISLSAFKKQVYRARMKINEHLKKVLFIIMLFTVICLCKLALTNPHFNINHYYITF